VLMERVVGSAGTLVLVAIGLLLAVGRYNNIREVLILEIVLSVGLVLALALMFSRRTNAWLSQPLGCLARVPGPASRAPHRPRRDRRLPVRPHPLDLALRRSSGNRCQ